MNTTESARAIRTELKKLGITSRQVSVRTDYYSMGSAIRITVKDPAVSLHQVTEIAHPHEDIDRDSVTGEILSGGNTYVTVQYDHDAWEVLTQRYMEPVEAAVAKLQGERQLEPVTGTPYLVGKNQWGVVSLWRDGWLCEGNVRDLAAQIGSRLAA